MKKKIFSIICLIVFIFIISSCFILFFYKLSIYPQNFIVTGIDYKNNIVYIETPTYGIDDWLVGDHCSAIMFDNYTKNIIDDKIVSVKYCGF